MGLAETKILYHILTGFSEGNSDDAINDGDKLEWGKGKMFASAEKVLETYVTGTKNDYFERHWAWEESF